METVPPMKKGELELLVRNGKLKIILNGLEIQESVHKFEYQRGDPAGAICSSVAIQLIVPIP